MKKIIILILVYQTICSICNSQKSPDEKDWYRYKIVYSVDTLNKYSEVKILDQNGEPIHGIYPVEIAFMVKYMNGKNDSTVNQTAVGCKSDIESKSLEFEVDYWLASEVLNNGWEIDRMSMICYLIRERKNWKRDCIRINNFQFEMIFKKLK